MHGVGGWPPRWRHDRPVCGACDLRVLGAEGVRQAASRPLAAARGRATRPRPASGRRAGRRFRTGPARRRTPPARARPRAPPGTSPKTRRAAWPRGGGIARPISSAATASQRRARAPSGALPGTSGAMSTAAAAGPMRAACMATTAPAPCPIRMGGCGRRRAWATTPATRSARSRTPRRCSSSDSQPRCPRNVATGSQTPAGAHSSGRKRSGTAYRALSA